MECLHTTMLRQEEVSCCSGKPFSPGETRHVSGVAFSWWWLAKSFFGIWTQSQWSQKIQKGQEGNEGKGYHGSLWRKDSSYLYWENIVLFSHSNMFFVLGVHQKYQSFVCPSQISSTQGRPKSSYPSWESGRCLNRMKTSQMTMRSFITFSLIQIQYM